MEPDHQLYRDFGRFESKLDALIDINARIETKIGKHEDRIATLESNQWKLGAAGAFVSAVVTFAVSYLTDIRSAVNKLIS